ncbi:MAG: hypothetical protein HYY40_08470 [Bacteroidetes bacterium]|nr:hypothetical protein [Bacteroidota bacterium]
MKKTILIRSTIIFWSVFLPILLGTGNGIAQETYKNSVRIDIARGGLHCPFLGPRLKEAVSKFEGVENITLNSKDSYLEFIVPVQNTPKQDTLVKIANNLGYPVQDIKVTVIAAVEKQ